MQSIDTCEFVTVTGDRIQVPDEERLVHLQFRRFAGCPVCDLHLRSVIHRHGEITTAGIREVVFFHSSAEELRDYDAPFAVVPDPEKRYYREVGVESGARALWHPGAWGAIWRGSALTLSGAFRSPARSQPHGRFGLPADFLVAPSGTLLAAKYGRHANDQWSVEELLAHARAAKDQIR